MYEPTYREPNNIIFIRDELESSGSGLDSTESGPIFVRAMEELNPGKLRQKTMPPGLENNKSEEKIFNVSNNTVRPPRCALSLYPGKSSLNQNSLDKGQFCLLPTIALKEVSTI